MSKAARKPRQKSPTDMQELANIADGARTVCFEHTIDGMKYELKLFLAKIREEWSSHTKDVWAHDVGLQVFEEVINALSRYNADFKDKYLTHEDGWGPKHPQWEMWPHLRQAKMHCPRPEEYESEEFFRFDLYGQRRVKFFMDIVEKLRPFIEAWRYERNVENVCEDDASRKKFIATLNTLRDAILALDQVLTEPEGPESPHDDEVYLKLCRTTRKGLALSPWLPDSAWGISPATRKRPAPVDEDGEDTPDAAGLRSRKRSRVAESETTMVEAGHEDGDEDEAIDMQSGTQPRPAPIDERNPSTSYATDLNDWKRSKAVGSENVAACSHLSENVGYDMFQKFRDWAQRPLPILTRVTARGDEAFRE